MLYFCVQPFCQISTNVSVDLARMEVTALIRSTDTSATALPASPESTVKLVSHFYIFCYRQKFSQRDFNTNYPTIEFS